MPPETPPTRLDITSDLCPMTFVKTRLELEELPDGALLEVLLREGEPLHNVTRSVEGEGHKILSREPLDGGIWRLLIQKTNR
ncbi:sulfurtransferase TusA family protein [soil metagenome]